MLHVAVHQNTARAGTGFSVCASGQSFPGVGLDLNAILAAAFDPPTAHPNIPSWKEARPLLGPWRWSDGARACLTNATPTPLRNAHAACALSCALAVADVASTRLAQERLPMRRPNPVEVRRTAALKLCHRLLVCSTPPAPWCAPALSPLLLACYMVCAAYL